MEPLLVDLAKDSAPFAARAAQCGYWPTSYWMESVLRAERLQKTTGVTATFTRLLEAGPANVPCEFAYQQAQGYLASWDRLGRGY